MNSLFRIAGGIGFDNRINVEHLPRQGERHFAVERNAQMIANSIFGAIFDVGVDNDSFANIKIAVARVGDFHQASAIFFYANHLARKIRVLGIQFGRRLIASNKYCKAYQYGTDE